MNEVNAGSTAGARRAPMQGPEGFLSRAGLGYAQNQQAQSLGRHVVTIPSLKQTRGDHP